MNNIENKNNDETIEKLNEELCNKYDDKTLNEIKIYLKTQNSKTYFLNINIKKINIEDILIKSDKFKMYKTTLTTANDKKYNFSFQTPILISYSGVKVKINQNQEDKELKYKISFTPLNDDKVKEFNLKYYDVEIILFKIFLLEIIDIITVKLEMFRYFGQIEIFKPKSSGDERIKRLSNFKMEDFNKLNEKDKILEENNLSKIKSVKPFFYSEEMKSTFFKSNIINRDKLKTKFISCTSKFNEYKLDEMKSSIVVSSMVGTINVTVLKENIFISNECFTLVVLSKKQQERYSPENDLINKIFSNNNTLKNLCESNNFLDKTIKEDIDIDSDDFEEKSSTI